MVVARLMAHLGVHRRVPAMTVVVAGIVRASMT
ncbi:hypothetical protein MTTB_p290 (plasmid) [Methanothermobacter tenebrarum]|uniref:Uncharacterized protein n=1 Tax=Methanothermobacter tenebrarum TaxID=680118 RepID=A0ABN6PDG6_9EURY|nr:hypothetical protein MTTB_p290 [Methanothermobacter tenebrarum]